MTIIKSLSNISFDTIFNAFAEAFKDYEMQVNKEEFRTMISRRGFDASLSFAAFEGGNIVAFTFNGIGKFNGIKTAYDTGTGTIESFRGKGLATKIFEFSIPFLKEAGIKQYLLEVLQHNEKAASVYKKIGFEISREFNYFVQNNEEIKLKENSLDTAFEIRNINLSKLKNVDNFWDFVPAWQNSFDAVKTGSGNFISTGVFHDDKLVAYSIFEANSGDITQIAVDQDYRRKGIATALLNKTLSDNKHTSIKIVNTEITCTSITNFLEANSIPVLGKQFEMIKEL